MDSDHNRACGQLGRGAVGDHGSAARRSVVIQLIGSLVFPGGEVVGRRWNSIVVESYAATAALRRRLGFSHPTNLNEHDDHDQGSQQSDYNHDDYSGS